MQGNAGVRKIGIAAIAMVAGGLMATATTSAAQGCSKKACSTVSGTCFNTDAKVNCSSPLPGSCFTSECGKT